ncbi:flagellar biosynthetic protein FliO [Amphibacillus sp. Q70]|uniref:flagellar biosynthetic protein FliO n=1 Tax=Amphibacillus sp. Q70 TaxID=3453416 RepID=UPI003F82DD5D
MKKLLPLIILFFFTINVMMLSAETSDDSVTDFFNQEESDSSEPDTADHQMMDEEEELEDEPQLLNNETPNIFGLIMRIVVVLALIIGLIYILLKLFNRTKQFNKQGEVLVNLGGISLGTNKSVQMLKVGEKIYLIGVGDNVSILTEVTDEDIKHQMLEKHQAPSLKVNSLFDQLNIKKEKIKTDDQQSEAKVNDNFASLFKGELDAMKEKREEIRAKYKEEE